MAKHRAREMFLPGSGKYVWCRRCTCVSTRKEWTPDESQSPECPVCGAPGYEARLLTAAEFTDEMTLHVPISVRNRNSVPRRTAGNGEQITKDE